MTKQNTALARRLSLSRQVFITIKKIEILFLASGEIGFDEKKKKRSKRQTTVWKLVEADSRYEGGSCWGSPRLTELQQVQPKVTSGICLQSIILTFSQAATAATRDPLL